MAREVKWEAEGQRVGPATVGTASGVEAAVDGSDTAGCGWRAAPAHLNRTSPAGLSILRRQVLLEPLVEIGKRIHPERERAVCHVVPWRAQRAQQSTLGLAPHHLEVEMWGDLRVLESAIPRWSDRLAGGNPSALPHATVKTVHVGVQVASPVIAKHGDSDPGPTHLLRRVVPAHVYDPASHSSPNHRRSLPGGEIERTVIDQLRAVLRAPEFLAQTYREARAQAEERLAELGETTAAAEAALRSLREEVAQAAAGGNGHPDPVSGRLADLQVQIQAQEHALSEAGEEMRRLREDSYSERDVVDALGALDPIWEHLFPDEQARIVQLLVKRVDVYPDRAEVRIRAEGLTSLVAELREEREVVAA
jgi:hypothetical protein